MDELLNPKTQKQTVIEKDLQYKGIGTMRKKKGLRLWALNKISGIVYSPELSMRKTAAVDTNGLAVELSKFTLVIQPDTEYLQALNKGNAVRKFKKLQDKGYYDQEMEIR